MKRNAETVGDPASNPGQLDDIMTERIWIRNLCKGPTRFIVIPAELKEFFKGVNYVKLKYYEDEDKLVITIASRHDYASETKNEWIRNLGRRFCHCRGGFSYMALTIPSEIAKKWASRNVRYLKVVFDGEKLIVSPVSILLFKL